MSKTLHVLSPCPMLLVLVLVAGPVAAQSNPNAPYNLTKFQPVLNDSKLQAPTSATLIPQGQFANQSNQYFYLAENKYMTFTVSGSSNRSELRQIPEWKTSTTSWRKMIGNVKVFFPNDASMNQFTWMQVHDSNPSVNKPLLRLTWFRSRSGVSDSLWAVIRTSVTQDTYEYVNMGPRPAGFFKAEIKIKDNLMTVKINDVSVSGINNRNVSYWSSLDNYFKVGTYNQNTGTSMVQFDTLNYYYQ